jgi:phosphoserine phosphatase
MDSTMVTGETLDELAKIAGIGDYVAAITKRAMNGEIDFAGALRERVGLLKGLGVEALERTMAGVTYTGGGETLVRTMKANGARTILVSGGFRFFTSRVRAQCGFDDDVANDLEIVDGRLTGRVIEPIVDRSVKLAMLRKAAADLDIPLALTAAVGDGANDLDMIQAAGLGVAFHAKPIVAEAAGARINHSDLTALLFAQGYRLDQFR